MFTPYDWQEAIGHRAQFVEAKLALGTPVLAASFEPGIVLLTYRRQARKIFEVYDRLALGGIGQQSDVNTIRIAAIDFAHQEGFNRSEQDVTLNRVLTAVSAPVKSAFSDFSASPVVATSLFAEVGNTQDDDLFGVLEYDGDFQTRKSFAYAAPTKAAAEDLEKRLVELKTAGLGVEQAVAALDKIWKAVADTKVDEDEDGKPDERRLESALLERRTHRESRFRHLGDLQ